MPDIRKVEIAHPNAKPLGRIFGFTSRTVSSSMTFFLLADTARMDADNSEKRVSNLTPGTIVAAHKLLDDMLNDALRRALMGSHGNSIPTVKRSRAEALLGKSLTSGTPTRSSKLDDFIEVFELESSADLLRDLKRLCDLRDIVFHDDAQPGGQDLWRSLVLDTEEMLRQEDAEATIREHHFLLSPVLIDFCERILRRFQRECLPVQASWIFDEPGDVRDGLPPTSEEDWRAKRESLLVDRA